MTQTNNVLKTTPPRRPWLSAAPSGEAGRLDRSARANYERYLALGRASARAGDAVEAENWYQHAEHYLRSMHPEAG